MIIVTGGAGFIGSCVVRSLNDAGIEDIIIVDDVACTDKWLNLCNKKYGKLQVQIEHRYNQETLSIA